MKDIRSMAGETWKVQRSQDAIPGVSVNTPADARMGMTVMLGKVFEATRWLLAAGTALLLLAAGCAEFPTDPRPPRHSSVRHTAAPAPTKPGDETNALRFTVS